MNIKRKDESILLCCGRGRCPEIKKSPTQYKHYEIKDDFGGTVLLRKEHLLALQEALRELDVS